MLEIFVDGDACPVKRETFRVARRYGLTLFVVAHAPMRLPDDPLIRLVVAGEDFGAVDSWILDHVRSNDIVITGDILLARDVLKSGAAALGLRGREFTENSIGEAIARYLPVTAGLRDNGTVVMNATGPEVLEPFRDKFRPAWVDGTTIAARNKIGTATAPIVNTAMVGAFAAATGIYDIEHVREAITAIFPGRAEQNFTAALEAFREVVLLPSGVTEALEQAYEGGSR